MNEKTLRALIEAGAVRRFHLIADGARIYVEADTLKGRVTAMTLKGDVKSWQTMDAAAKWLRGLGIGEARIEMAHWQPRQKALALKR